jgi:hypothetical protein
MGKVQGDLEMKNNLFKKLLPIGGRITMIFLGVSLLFLIAVMLTTGSKSTQSLGG